MHEFCDAALKWREAHVEAAWQEKLLRRLDGGGQVCWRGLQTRDEDDDMLSATTMYGEPWLV